MTSKKRISIFSILLFIVSFSISTFLIYLGYESFLKNSKNESKYKLDTIQRSLENKLNSKIHLSELIAGFFYRNENITFNEFNEFSKFILKGNENQILSLQWAPNGVIQYVYPYEQNQKAIGLNLFEYSTTKESSNSSLLTKNAHMNGPVPLVQGGIGFIYRVPVFEIDTLNFQQKSKFSGFSAVVVEWKTLINETELLSFSLEDVAIKHPDSFDEYKFFNNGVFYGNENLFKEKEIVKSKFSSAHGNWEIALRVHYNQYLVELFYVSEVFALILCFILSILYFKNSLKNHDLKSKNIDLENKNLEINQQIKEKVILMNEIHHRVKNNFQLISSIARLQSYEINDPKAIQTLNEFGNMVSSFALTHEQLYKNSSGNNADISEYILSLTKNFKDANPNINFELDCDSEKIPVKILVSLGIILNELITNSIKHAFQQNKKATISIQLKKDEQNEIKISYSDNGIGFNQSILNEDSETFGIGLIKLMVEQIEGTIKTINNNGFVIKFKV